MRFKCGDVVIKNTGGNKMTIFENIDDNTYHCIWFVESSYNEAHFSSEEIVSIQDYKRILKTEEREDKINKILSSELN
jgi:uncharacterized protein YodC (DUF2158 family)